MVEGGKEKRDIRGEGKKGFAIEIEKQSRFALE